MKTRDLAYIAIFAALTAVLGLVPAINVGPVPITAQTLGVMLAGSVLGAKRGFLALLLFLLLVAIGLPLLPGGRGGLGVFVGPTAGYLYAWPLGAFVVGLVTELAWRRFNLAWAALANVVGGVLVIYAVGIPFVAVYADEVTLGQSLTGSLSFLPGDAVKVAVASLIAVQVRRAYPVIERPRGAAATP
ncbi:biotin transporter BioY [Modestobacter marinus]|uniref:biotin transporter BioY n=1 Tax=Modestobacter marinus TaxID=477641 RepID=UPI001C977708|nr:biotin transporter BioY [Modestobacter marinus]